MIRSDEKIIACLLLLLTLGLGISVAAQADEPSESTRSIGLVEPDQATNTSPKSNIVEDTSSALDRAKKIQLFEQQLASFKLNSDGVNDYFEELRDETRLRLWQFSMALDYASKVSDIATIDPAKLEADHPGFDQAMYQLPNHIVTVSDLYGDLQDLYWARTQMLELTDSERHQQAVGIGLMGMQELRSEIDLIKVEVRYQALRLPQAIQQIRRMLVQAPVTLAWFVIKFIFTILIFRWWRSWLPGTLQRMRSSLLGIRPRTGEVVARLRGLWYFDQVRRPLEWLLFWSFMFGLFQFQGLEFIRDVSLIAVRWILLAWFSVEVLNAIAARGAGGLAGESAKLRLKSMRLIANWLMLLGLGLDLFDNLAGNAALISWTWRIFQLLAIPLILRLLTLWHMELYLRLQREGDTGISDAEYAEQRGFSRWAGSAKVAGLLVASWLRSSLLRRIEHFETTGNKITSATSSELGGATELSSGLPQDTREILIKGYDDYQKYARSERRQLVERINAHESGVVNVVGERGVGKGNFLRQVAEAHHHGSIFIDCKRGDFATLKAAFEQQLGLAGPDISDEEISTAISEQGIRFIAINNLHLLVRPVIGGFSEFARLSDLFTRVQVPVLWALAIDSFAYHFITQARADYNLAGTHIQLRGWSEEQISEFIENSCETAKIKPDFSKIRVPRQHMDTAQDVIEDRNRAGTYAMISSLSRGNPSIAIRLFADCLHVNKQGVIEVTLPANLKAQTLEDASIKTQLVLRVLAQSELITFEDIVSNLRFDPSVVKATLHFTVLAGWVEHRDGLYRLTWPWFRAITQLLSRQNLLAGARQEAN